MNFTMPKSKKPRKKYRQRNTAQAVYAALIFAGFTKNEAEIIARASEPPESPKDYLAIRRK